MAIAHQLQGPVKFLGGDRFAQGSLQLAVHFLFDHLQVLLGATGLKHHQASLFEGGHIHVDGFDNLQVFAQALHQSAAPSLGQNRRGQISTRDGQLIRCCRYGPDHQQTCRFKALELATLAATLERQRTGFSG